MNTKLHIPITIAIVFGSGLVKPFGQMINGLDSGRLACTSSKTQNLKDYSKEYFHPEDLKNESNNP